MTLGRNRSGLTVAASAIALALALPLSASADPQSRIVGTVTDFHGKYGLVVRDQGGALAEIALRPGTVIKPEGLRLERGMKVIVVGHAADRTFAAAEIDAPYEQWPTARALALAHARNSGGDKADTGPPFTSGNRGDAGRWSEFPDQFSVPTVREPANPH